MKILFVNTQEQRCGVHQFGEGVFEVLSRSGLISVEKSKADSQAAIQDEVATFKPDWIIYNWSQLIGGWISYAPFAGLARQALLYHDGAAKFGEYDRILFADPTMGPHENWRPIGRPIPIIDDPLPEPTSDGRTWVGVNGFLGAWANRTVEKAVSEFSNCGIRLHLPYAVYGDAAGGLANWSEDYCRKQLPPGVPMEVCHSFLSRKELVFWLAKNHLNCYLRDASQHWHGVSSVLDFALAARRPIAITTCTAFRHMNDCSPTIYAEYRSLPDILSTGLTPLLPKYEAWSTKNVAKQIIEALQ